MATRRGVLTALWIASLATLAACSGARATSSPPTGSPAGVRPASAALDASVASAPADASLPSVDAAAATDAAATTAATTAATAPGNLTDEECVARGGHVETEQTYRYDRRRRPGAPVTPYRVCRIPSPSNGRACSGDAECGLGRCRCAGALARPEPRNDPALRALDGTPAAGVCSDAHLAPGTWWCLVEHGRVVLHGIIID